MASKAQKRRLRQAENRANSTPIKRDEPDMEAYERTCEEYPLIHESTTDLMNFRYPTYADNEDYLASEAWERAQDEDDD